MDLWLYVYGNGDFILNILTSVNFFMKNAMSFFKLATMLSLAFFAFEATGVFPSRGYDWARFLRLYVLMALFVMTPYPGKITVHDVITNEDRVLNVSDKKIPFGLIFPTAIASTIANRLINLYQQNFEIDSNLNYTYSGMNFGANFITALDSANSYDGNFNYNFDQYMQNCGFPLVNKQGALSELRDSKDIFATLAKYTSNARFVQNVDFNEGKTNIVMSCSDALTKITDWYNNNQNQIMQNNAQMMGSAPSQYDRFVNSANATSSTLLGISQGASAALKQAIGMNMMMASLKNGAHAAGNGTLALAAYDAEAFQEYKKSSELSGSASARSVPIMVGIAFTLLFFLYPIMIFMAVAMGSYKVIGMFFRIIVCINLIPLMYEIINYMTTFYLQKKLGTLTITGQGYTYDLSTSIYSFSDNMIIASNWLAASTPILAWAIVSGAQTAVSSVFSHINDPAKERASKQGDNLADGNNNIGNTNIDNHSFNNISGNKLDDQFSINSGEAIMKQTTGHGVRTNIGGNNFDVQYKDQLNTGVNLSSAATHSLENRLSQSKEQSTQLSQQWGKNAQRAHELANGIDSGRSIGSDVGVEDRNALSHIQDLSTSISAGLKTPQFFAHAGVDGRSSSADNLNKQISEYKHYRDQLSHSSNQNIRDAFSSTDSLSSSTSNLVSAVTSTSKALSDIKSNSAGVNSDFTTDWANNMRAQGIDPKAMTTEQQHASANAYVGEYLHKNYGIRDNLTTPSVSHHNAAMPSTPNTNGLDLPSDGSTTAINMNKATARVNEGVNNFNENPGNVMGNQVVEQAKTGAAALNNMGDAGSELMYNIAHPDRVLPQTNTSKGTPDKGKNEIPD